MVTCFYQVSNQVSVQLVDSVDSRYDFIPTETVKIIICKILSLQNFKDHPAEVATCKERKFSKAPRFISWLCI